MVKWFPKQDYGYEGFVIFEPKLIVCCSGTGWYLGARGGGTWHGPDSLLNPLDHNE